MLKSGNLDDQSFREIMDFVYGRLPWVAPYWTDYNAHDPGITIFELLAWYKEMQQYHLNSVTDEIKQKLLKTAGFRLRPAAPARCFFDVPQSIGALPHLSRIVTREGIPFELPLGSSVDAVPQAIFIEAPNGALYDISDPLAQPNISVYPFSHGADNTRLIIGFPEIGEDGIRLWIDIDDERPVARNAFDADSKNPRVIEWSSGGRVIVPTSDETHAMSKSGFLCFDGDEFEASTLDGRAEKLHYITATLSDPGCEERVRLRGIIAGRREAVQRETWAHLDFLTVSAEPELRVAFDDALAAQGRRLAFLRTENGLVQLPPRADDTGGAITVDTAAAATDGEPNLIAVGIDALHYQDLFFDATGLPDMRLRLSIGEKRVLTEDFLLICDTRMPDGAIRPEVWHYVDNLSCCTCNDHVFTLSRDGEWLIFGDGEFGAIVPRGENAILLASFAVSYCSGGNIPAGTATLSGEHLLSELPSIPFTAAVGGVDAQSVGDGIIEFTRRLEASRKCNTAEDYEYFALTTPGLRVAAAKALPGFDEDEPTGVSRIPVVTVVVVPYGEYDHPLPSAQFLATIRARLREVRPICTRVKVAAPIYSPIGVSVKVITNGNSGTDEEIRATIRDYFRLSSSRSIGAPVHRSEIFAALMQCEGVRKLEVLELRPEGPGCRLVGGSDIVTPQNAIAYPVSITVDITVG